MSGNAEITDNVLKVASAGNVTVQLEIDLFRGMLTKSMYLNFEDPVETDPGVNPDAPSGGNETKDDESADNGKDNTGNSGGESKDESESGASPDNVEKPSSGTSSDKSESSGTESAEKETTSGSASSTTTGEVQDTVGSSSNSTATISDESTTSIPMTGDAFPYRFCLILMLISGGILTVAAYKNRKK